MPTISFVDQQGVMRHTTGRDGISVMEAAIRADIPGIVADCGGECSCATCHVEVDRDWFSVTGGPGEMEDQLLELAPGRTPTSRLSCQIKLSPVLDGLIVHVPLRQRG